MVNLKERIESNIQTRNQTDLAHMFEQVRRIYLDEEQQYTDPSLSGESVTSAQRLLQGFFRWNINAEGVLVPNRALTVWGSPIPHPSQNAMVAYNIEADSNQTSDNLNERFKPVGINNNEWIVVAPASERQLARYQRMRRLNRILPDRMFYNQPNKGEQVTKEDINENWYIPKAQARLHIYVDHAGGPEWDGQWSYRYTPAQQAAEGDHIMTYRQSYERFEELGLAHVVLADRIAMYFPRPVSQEFAYRGLFAYPPQRKAQ